MRSILVVNPKGGCGKSTVATNLASYYAVWGVPTTLVDYDSQHSSLEWLQARPETYEPISGVDATNGHAGYPSGTERALMDAPAHIDNKEVNRLINKADVVLIPVLPSAMDIRAAAHFIGDLLVQGKIREQRKRVGVIANRVRENTIVYGQLTQFLKGVKIPFVTSLRDTQNYIRAAERGVGIFEFAPYMVQQDLEQWRPLINWVEGKR
ncbi:MAG: ParA family protein [Gammaproteobacteria bacterium]|nr:ParA family protein [Gammaproteobacteria bacterium]